MNVINRICSWLIMSVLYVVTVVIGNLCFDLAAVIAKWILSLNFLFRFFMSVIGYPVIMAIIIIPLLYGAQFTRKISNKIYFSAKNIRYYVLSGIITIDYIYGAILNARITYTPNIIFAAILILTCIFEKEVDEEN